MPNRLIASLLGFIQLFAFTIFAQTPAAPASYRADQILVMPKTGVGIVELGRLHGLHRAAVRRSFKGFRGLQVVRLAAGDSVDAAIARYQQSGLVEFAEPDYQIHLSASLPNDPKFLDGTLWGLNNTGQNGGTPDADIDAPEAWDVLTSASNIVVAVVDTGIRYTHEDLAANMWTNPNDGSHGWNAIASNNNPWDDSTHGTLVAGVLGAVGNNGKGVVGVAWQVQLMACKAFDSSGNGVISDAVTCLDFARTNGARIINASWGFNPDSAALSNAIATLQNDGIIVVTACGNSSQDIDLAPTYPASYPFDNIVSVAYTTRNDVLAGPSNFGATNVDLAAPGESIMSTFPATDSFYYPISGSSAAAPYVSGALALMLAKFPGETYQQIIARLLNGTDPLPSLTGKCVTGGRLNLRKALSPEVWLEPLADAPLQFRVFGGPNRVCVVDTSTNLTTWDSVYIDTTGARGSFDYTSALPASPQRFFRARSTP
jgi:subtilisin family serine protease